MMNLRKCLPPFFQNILQRTLKSNRSKSSLPIQGQNVVETVKTDNPPQIGEQSHSRPIRKRVSKKKSRVSVNKRLLAIKEQHIKSSQPVLDFNNSSKPLTAIGLEHVNSAVTQSEIFSKFNNSPNNDSTQNHQKVPDINETLQVSNFQSSEITKVHLDNHEDVDLLEKKFPFPKNTVNNFYTIISQDLKKSVHPSIKYKPEKNRAGNIFNWTCSYHIKYPEEIIFSAKSSTKKAVSKLASLKVIAWLKEKNFISDTGSPSIQSKEELKLIKQKTDTLFLDNQVFKAMEDICQIYKEYLSPSVTKQLQEDTNNNSIREAPQIVTQEPSDMDFTVHKQRYLGSHAYLAKEKVVLPISKYKENFMKLITNNNLVIVKGEPGCGKSTRIPQYVLESWTLDAQQENKFCRIAVTQPRRIAAISLAERVASERNERVGDIVGYQVRLNSKFRYNTGRVLYCTTGILLRHLQSDPHLRKFSHIILDEAHERDINTDLLMNLLKDAIEVNPNLKLIVMSATIDTDMFQNYFKGAPIMEVPGFTYPVKQNFLDSCSKIDMSKTIKMCQSEYPTVVHEDVVKVIKHIHKTRAEGAILVFLPGWEDINKIRNLLPKSSNEIAVYCLHSRLRDEEQFKIFSKPPPGIRKIILATNIAETSVTIDDVVYVIETGIHKDKRFDADKGISSIDNHWISKANVKQRIGRAGRVQPGEGFLLYSKSKYDSFPDYSPPEILNSSLTKLVLDAKAITNNMEAVEFMNKLITPPEENSVLRAVDELKDLELIDNEQRLTPLGKTLAEFQLEPKLAKALVNSVIFKCVTPVVDIITLFSAETEIFSTALVEKAMVQKSKKAYSKTSDHLALMRIFEKFSELSEDPNSEVLQRFCNDLNLVPYKLETIEKLKEIHFGYLYNGLQEVMPISDDLSDSDELVKAVLFSGIENVLQHRKWDIVKNRLKTNVNVLVTRHNHKATITPESVNHKRNKFPSRFLMYFNETRSNVRRITSIRETSLIPEISVLLFSNKNLKIDVLDKDQFSKDLKSDDQVKLSLENTKISFICDRRDAQQMILCKNVIMSCYQYYIKELTQRGNFNAEFNQHWDSILAKISKILTKYSL